MIRLSACSEDLENGCACVMMERTPLLRTEKREFPISLLGSAMILGPSPEMELWLLRSGVSPRAHLPMSRIGIYTDFV